jgi:hypothetical protein
MKLEHIANEIVSQAVQSSMALQEVMCFRNPSKLPVAQDVRGL